MSRTTLLGNLPIYVDGVNKGRLMRNETAKLYKFSLDEISKAYNNWIQIFRFNGSSLTFEQYLNKMTKEKIRPFDIGNNIDQFNLSRYNDFGPYTDENCRFIPRPQNLFEQKKESPYYKILRKFGEQKAKELVIKAGKSRKKLDRCPSGEGT